MKKEKRSKMKKCFSLLLALVMSLSLVACGGGDTANEDTSTDDTATEENGGDTATASDVEIAVVLKTLASEYWGYVKAGCDAAAADLGVTVNVVGQQVTVRGFVTVAVIDDDGAARLRALRARSSSRFL